MTKAASTKVYANELNPRRQQICDYWTNKVTWVETNTYYKLTNLDGTALHNPTYAPTKHHQATRSVKHSKAREPLFNSSRRIIDTGLPAIAPFRFLQNTATATFSMFTIACLCNATLSVLFLTMKTATSAAEAKFNFSNYCNRVIMGSAFSRSALATSAVDATFESLHYVFERESSSDSRPAARHAVYALLFAILAASAVKTLCLRLPFRHRIMPAETCTCLMLATLPCTYGMSVIPQDLLSTEAETCATADPDFKVHDSTSSPSRCRHRSYTMTTVAVIIVMACVWRSNIRRNAFAQANAT